MSSERQTGAATDDAQPLFVICCSRTGSTLLRYIIDTHPQVTCPPEFHLGRLASQLDRAYRILLDIERCTDEASREASIKDSVRAHLDSMLRDHCKHAGKGRWCEKSVFNIDHIDLIRQLFPGARFICLYRNALDTIASGLEVLRRFDPQGWRYGFDSYLHDARPSRIAGLTDYWLDKTQRILRLEADAGDSCMRVTYESLVLKSEETVDALQAFMGVDYEDGLVDRVFETHHTRGPGDPKIRREKTVKQDSLGRGRGLPLSLLGSTRLQAINTLHQQLNYPTLETSGLSRLCAKALQATRICRQTPYAPGDLHAVGTTR